MKQPAIFISHGSPMVVLEDSAAHHAIGALGNTLEKPDAIVIASAHHETMSLNVVSDPSPDTIHDFGPFDDRLFSMVYPAEGSPELARRVVAYLSRAGLESGLNPSRGFDHGTWTPLMLAFPEADIPVVQVSVQPQRDAAHHFAVGRALAGLRSENILIVGSGHITHNLRIAFAAMQGQAFEQSVSDRVDAFTDWIKARIEAGDTDALLKWSALAPEAAFNHPTPEHFMPLFFAMGAGGKGYNAELLHRSTQYHYLTSDIWRFD